MEAKHTAGTWHEKDGQIYPEETGKTLAIVYTQQNEAEEKANGKLIAAAPYLLEALIKINSMIADLSNYENAKLNTGAIAKISIDAINKATN